MKNNAILQELEAGKTLFGLSNMYPAPGIIRSMCKGWDFAWIDGQHGLLSYDSIYGAVQVAENTGVHSIIRVPGHAQELLQVYADVGSDALMIPVVDTAKQAADIVRALTFPPGGIRSFGGRGVIDKYGVDYFEKQHVAVIAQIETVESVQNAADIIGTTGIDMIFLGADDLKLSMGLPRDASGLNNKELADAMKHIADVAKKNGKFSGCVAISKEMIELSMKMGYQLIAAGVDVVFLRNGAAQKLKEVRELSGQA